MSTCISIEGEYGSHEVGEFGTERFTCRRCFVFDQDAAMAALDAAETALRDMEIERNMLRITTRELTEVLEAGDACGAVGCRAIAERDSLAVQLDEALRKVGRVKAELSEWADEPDPVARLLIGTLTAVLAGPSPTAENDAPWPGRPLPNIGRTENGMVACNAEMRDPISDYLQGYCDVWVYPTDRWRRPAMTHKGPHTITRRQSVTPPAEPLTEDSFCRACSHLLSGPPHPECIHPEWHTPTDEGGES